MRPFGSDRVERAPEGAYLLICSISKGWSPRRRKTLTSPEYPGTAVRWEGDLFEVVEAVAQSSGGIGYRLAPWQRRHTIRSVSTYDAEAESAREREQALRRGALRKRRASILLAPLLGHLPGRVQQRMESEFGAPARAMTIASALPLLVLGFLGILAFLVASFGGGDSPFSGWPLLPLPVSLFLSVESAVRLGIAFLHGEPLGSVAGAAVYALWSNWHKRPDEAERRYASASDTKASQSRKEGT
jgi:hypothetical protein